MRIKALTPLFILLAMTLSCSALAQPGSGNLAEGWAMTVKKGQQVNFEAAFKAHGAIRKENGDPRNWSVYVPVTGDDLTVYFVRTCCYAWADQDAYTEWESQHPAVMTDWFENVDQYVENYGHYFTEMDWDNSHWNEGQVVRYVGVTDYAILPGKAAEFHAARRELSQIAINQGWADDHSWAWSDQVGGKPSASLVVPFASFADMGDDEESFYNFIIEHKGQEGAAALVENFADSVKGSKYSIWAHRPDLSTGNSD